MSLCGPVLSIMTVVVELFLDRLDYRYISFSVNESDVV